jgi:YggT family protein
VNPVGALIELVLWLFLLFLFVRFVVDVVQSFARSWSPHGVILVVLEGVYTVTDPPIKAIRRILPPLRLGGMILDLTLMAVMLITYLLLYINRLVWA